MKTAYLFKYTVFMPLISFNQIKKFKKSRIITILLKTDYACSLIFSVFKCYTLNNLFENIFIELKSANSKKSSFSIFFEIVKKK